MAAAGIEFANVSYAVADGHAAEHQHLLLRDIALTLEPGTTTAILGRSGSGKTTLLRMVNALAMPTAGEVRIGGRSTRDVDPVQLRRSIGYVIQETGLFPHMTVERNTGMALELAGTSPADKHRRIQEVLALTGLDSASPDFAEFRARYPWQLSGGQRQRVGLARALAADPSILLMDEPFGALDPLTRAEMQTMLRSLLARVGKTVLLVTHDLDEALYLAGRVIFLGDNSARGQIVADLPSAEVMQSANPHVREYVRAVRRGVSDAPTSLRDMGHPSAGGHDLMPRSGA